MENQSFYLVLLVGGGMFVFLLTIFIMLFVRGRREKKLLESQVYIKDSSPPEYYRSIYRFLSNNRITRSYTARVRLRYEMLEPGSVEHLERDTVRSVMLLVLLVAAATVTVLLAHASFYSILLVIFTIYCVNSEYLSVVTQRMKLTILGQLRTEIEHIQNNYNHSEDVCDAIYECALNAPFPVKNHLLCIWEVLQADDMHINSEVERFNIRSPLPYLKDLLSCAKETSKYGDNNVHGISNFILKLTGIMNAVSAAERIEEERQQAFSGMTVVSMLPFYLKPAANWFAKQMFEVRGYIDGVYGILSTIVVFLASLVIYGVVSHRKELDYTCARSHPTLQRISMAPVIRHVVNYMTNSNMARKHAIQGRIHKIGESLTVEQFMAQRILFASVAGTVTLATCLFIQVSIRSTVLVSTGGISTRITEGTTEEEELAITDFVITTAQELKNEELSDASVMGRVQQAGDMFKTDTARMLVADEISGRVESYQHAYFQSWYLLLAAFAMFGCSFIPYLLIRRDSTLVAIRSNDEIMRFQTIISCMKDIRRGSTKEVLEEMELSADIFRNTLTDCIDEYSADPLYALECFQLRERDHPLLQQICMKFIRADRVGLQRAFANLEAEMVECQKSREQKCRYYIHQASNLAYMMVFIPFFLVVVLEAMVPIGMAMMEQMAIMNGMLG